MMIIHLVDVPLRCLMWHDRKAICQFVQQADKHAQPHGPPGARAPPLRIRSFEHIVAIYTEGDTPPATMKDLLLVAARKHGWNLGQGASFALLTPTILHKMLDRFAHDCAAFIRAVAGQATRAPPVCQQSHGLECGFTSW